MIYNKSNSTDKQTTKGLSYFFKKVVPDKEQHNNKLSLFNAATKFYSAIPGDIYNNPMELMNCFALTLARTITEKAAIQKDIACSTSMFPEEFYSACADDLIKQGSSIQDRELLIIYLKQSAHILKKSGIIIKEKDYSIHIVEILSKVSLYRKIFDSFWNRQEWETIFPSSPEAANSLYENRESFIALLSGYYESVNIEVLANDFFDLSGICPRNDYFMISFIDFYLLTWLKHFGILEYSYTKNDDNIYVSLTESGRSFLKSIS